MAMPMDCGTATVKAQARVDSAGGRAIALGPQKKGSTVEVAQPGIEPQRYAWWDRDQFRPFGFVGGLFKFPLHGGHRQGSSCRIECAEIVPTHDR